MSEPLLVKGLCKSYKLGSRRLEVLKDVSFEVQPGELVAVTGPSGIGKTTLLHLIGTLDHPDSGEILYGGKAQSSMDAGELAAFRNSTIGFVFQFFQLLPEFSTLENVMMPALIAGAPRAEARTLAQRVLTAVNLQERWHHFPNQLSGGEQQRAAIARALVRSPRLLLADEPTGNLDVKTGMRVFSLFRELQQSMGLTSIIVSHNLEIAGKCDRVLDLTILNFPDGRLSENKI